MKRPVLWMSLLGLLCGSLAFGQGKVPANLVDVVPTNFDFLLSGTNYSLYVAPTSRTENTAQHIFDWLDDWSSAIGFGPFFPGTNIENAVYNETNLTWEGLGNMPGTNIQNATYNETNLTWEGLMPGTNIQNATYNETNLTWEGLMPGTNIVGATLVSNQWTGLMPGTNISGFAYNPTTLTWSATSSAGVAGTLIPIFDVWSTNEQACAASEQTLADNYEVTVTNTGSAFNPVTGVFTAPTNGYYFFVAGGRFSVVVNESAGIGLADLSWTNSVASPFTSARYPHTGASGPQSASGHLNQSDSIFKYMEPGDTMCVWMNGTTGYTNWHKYFQGFSLE